MARFPTSSGGVELSDQQLLGVLCRCNSSNVLLWCCYNIYRDYTTVLLVVVWLKYMYANHFYGFLSDFSI
jgi:hypothetical protein